jgi:nucleoside-specific outer membrane channel protein Tsx
MKISNLFLAATAIATAPFAYAQDALKDIPAVNIPIKEKGTPFIQWQSTSAQFFVPTSEITFQPESNNFITIQHAHGNQIGDFFAFVDLFSENSIGDDGWYGEISPRFSLNKIFDEDLKTGPFNDILLATNFEFGKGLDPRSLIGVGTNIEIPGFKFTEINLYHRDNPSLDGSTFQLTFAWSRPFEIGGQKFSFDGFLDYAGAEGGSSANFLAQPQLWWHVNDKLKLGTEVLIWRNKFGVDDVNEVNTNIGFRFDF